MADPVDTSTPTRPPITTVVPLRRESAPTEATTADSFERPQIAGTGSALPSQAVDTRSTVTNQRESARELAEATRDVASFIQTVSRSLQISVDGDLGSTIVRVLDTETDELIRQIPSEEFLQIARYLRQQGSSEIAGAAVRGILLDSEG